MEVLIGNDNLVSVSALKDEVGGSFVNAGTVTGSLKDSADTELAALTFAYVAASDGNWRAVIEDGVSLTDGTRYVLHIDVDAGDDKVGHWELPVRARVRRS